MKKVLIFENKIHDIVEVGAEFPVAREMKWVDAPDTVDSATHEFNGKAFDLKLILVTPPVQAFVATLAPLDFLERFTLTEQLAITTAAMQSPMVRLWYDKMIAARSIDVADARVIAGLDALIAAGLLSASRKSVLLIPAGQIPVALL